MLITLRSYGVNKEGKRRKKGEIGFDLFDSIMPNELLIHTVVLKNIWPITHFTEENTESLKGKVFCPMLLK